MTAGEGSLNGWSVPDDGERINVVEERTPLLKTLAQEPTQEGPVALSNSPLPSSILSEDGLEEQTLDLRLARINSLPNGLGLDLEPQQSLLSNSVDGYGTVKNGPYLNGEEDRTAPKNTKSTTYRGGVSAGRFWLIFSVVTASYFVRTQTH